MTNVNFTVTFNPIRKSCKVNINYIKTTENIEYIQDDSNTKRPVQIVEIGVLEQMRAGERKSQIA